MCLTFKYRTLENLRRLAVLSIAIADRAGSIPPLVFALYPLPGFRPRIPVNSVFLLPTQVSTTAFAPLRSSKGSYFNNETLDFEGGKKIVPSRIVR